MCDQDQVAVSDFKLDFTIPLAMWLQPVVTIVPGTETVSDFKLDFTISESSQLQDEPSQ